MSGTGRQITKRACDGCKIRKVKCSGLSPCDGCTTVRISCTFLKTPGARGPRKLRRRTLQEIAQTQKRHWQQSSTSSSTANVDRPSSAKPPTQRGIPIAKNEPLSRIPTASLVLHLCVYRLRMFPVWPVVKVEEIISMLQRNEKDIETYALANAVGAATVAQLKLTSSSLGGDAVSGEMMEAECQRARTTSKADTQLNLTTLRTAFFLHVYHENQIAGGMKSLLYLREAITIGQMMGLHRESSYATLSPAEEQIRRRLLWLLFVTERGVTMLHKLPVVLKPNILFPSMDRDDETFVLPAFQKLVNLFWIFDQSGAFDILQDSDADVFGYDGLESPSRNCLDLLQRRLREVPIDGQSINDIQTADICVTRQWMRAVLWRFSVNHGLLSPLSNDQATSLSFPFLIAKEFLSVISQLPNSAIEAHGQAMELKVYEIASSVTDAIARSALTVGRSLSGSSSLSMDQPGDILHRLHQILCSCRGGNQLLVNLLCGKIAEVQENQLMLLEPSSRIVEGEGDDESWWIESADDVGGDLEFDVSLQLDGTNAFPEIGSGNQVPFSDFDTQKLSLQISSSLFSSVSTGTTITISDQSPSLQPQPQHQPHLLFPADQWPFSETPVDAEPMPAAIDHSRDTELYAQLLQQSFGGGSGGGMWGFGGGVEGWSGSGVGPEAVEGWN